MSIDEDYDFLFDVNDDDREEGEKKQKNSKVVPIALVLVLVIGVAAALIFGTGSDDSAQKQPTAAPKIEKQSLQLVNTQQVEWARGVCILVNEWSSKMIPMKESEKPLSSREARKRMVRNINFNTNRINESADSFLKLPEDSIAAAKDKSQETLITDNNLKVGDTVDTEVDRASRDLSSAFAGYSSSLKNISSQLKGIADYDVNGIRSGISESTKSIDDLNSQLSSNIEKTLGEGLFDNVATMSAVADVEECSGSFINKDELEKEKPKEVKEQKMVSDYAVSERCRKYIDDNTGNSSEDVSVNITACQDFLAENTVNTSDPLFSKGVDTMDNKRQQPGDKPVYESSHNGSNDDGSSSPSESESSKTSATSNDSSRTSSSKSTSSRSSSRS